MPHVIAPSRRVAAFLLIAAAVACQESVTIIVPPEDDVFASPPFTSWTLLGGRGDRGSWDSPTARSLQVRAMIVHRGAIYVGLCDNENTVSLGQVWRFDGTGWVAVGGGGLRGSWTGKQMVGSLASDGVNLYAGVGADPGDAEVWSYDGSSWTKIGGDGLAGGWDSTHDMVWTMTVFRSQLYAGLFTEKLGEQRPVLYRYDGSTWHYLAGDESPGANARSGWAKNDGIIMVYRLYPDRAGQYLYVTLAGRGETPDGEPRAGTGQLWRFDGSQFEMIGGRGVLGSWNYDETFYVEDVTEYRGSIVASLQRSVDGFSRTAIWRFDGISWAPLTPAEPAEWDGIQNFNTLLTVGDTLIVGAGLPSGVAATIWSLKPGGSWLKIGGAGTGSDWHARVAPSTTQWVYPMILHRGHLLIGLASAESVGAAEVWMY